jgi:hypothetical protein
MAQPRETTTKAVNGTGPVPTPIETMRREREYCPFDKRKLSEALHDGRANLELCVGGSIHARWSRLSLTPVSWAWPACVATMQQQGEGEAQGFEVLC